MRLLERGQIDLDAALVTHVPDLQLSDQPVARRVTMRHLLTHTAGWKGDYFDPINRGNDALAMMVSRTPRARTAHAAWTGWSYNNSGLYLAGRVIDVLSGLPYEQAVRELVLEPLSLRHS